MKNTIDIGSIIKETLKSEGISVPEFAEKIHCTERNVYKIFNKTSIDTALLMRISLVLNTNLFIHFFNDGSGNNRNLKDVA